MEGIFPNPLDVDPPLEAHPPCRQTPYFVNGMTHASKNITLPKASFAGRNEEVFALLIIACVTTS